MSDENLTISFLNVISEKAEIVDVADYSGYYNQAIFVIQYLCDQIVEDEPENLFCIIDKKDGFYYLPDVTAKYLIKKFNPNAGIKTIRTVLEKLGMKTEGDCYIEICGQNEKVWKLSVSMITYYGVLK